MSSNPAIGGLRAGSKAALFLELAQPDNLGFSRCVSISEFVGRYAKLQFGNGGDWIRQDGSLAKHYNILRHPAGRGKITHVQLEGFKKVAIQKPIPEGIRRDVTAGRCVILATGSPQCDHKDGRRDDPRLSDATKVVIEDFQPLSRSANDAKRQHCRECRDTGNRFDAMRLGYSGSHGR